MEGWVPITCTVKGIFEWNSPGENKESGVPDTWQKHGVTLLKVVASVEPDIEKDTKYNIEITKWYEIDTNWNCTTKL